MQCQGESSCQQDKVRLSYALDGAGAHITISVDDTGIDRLVTLIRLTYSWFSGKHKKVVRGQSIIAITVKVDAFPSSNVIQSCGG